MNKRILLYVSLAVGLILPLSALQVWFSSAPTSANSGEPYLINANVQADYSEGHNSLGLWKNGTCIGYISDGDYEISIGTWQADSGPQTIEYYAEAQEMYFDWNGWQEWMTLDSMGAWHYITINAANQAPFGCHDYHDAIVPQNGSLYAAGWAADNEMGAPVSRVDILIDGNDVGDATLGGYLPDVADAYGRSDYTYSGWSFNYNIGALSVGTHTLELVARDNQGASTSFGYTTFEVTNSAPDITLLLPSAQSIRVGTALMLSSHATDVNGDISNHNLDIQRPNGTWNWQGGFAAGEPYIGGPVGSGADSTRTASFPFDEMGTWYVRSWVQDSVGHNLHSATVAITVYDINTNASVSPAAITLGSSVTLTRNGSATLGIARTENVILKPNGQEEVLGNQPLGTQTYTPAAGAGTYTYKFRIVDNSSNYMDQQIPFTVAAAETPLPDAWQIDHFGHLGVDPNADPDGDGKSNYQEYLDGTNPLIKDTPYQGTDTLPSWLTSQSQLSLAAVGTWEAPGTTDGNLNLTVTQPSR